MKGVSEDARVQSPECPQEAVEGGEYVADEVHTKLASLQAW